MKTLQLLLSTVALTTAMAVLSATPASAENSAGSVAFEQQQNNATVRVHVFDKAGSLPGASVVVKGTDRGFITDSEGIAVIEKCHAGTVLAISFVGYDTQEITVGSNLQIEVLLETSDLFLDESVVVGYGSLKSSMITNSITKVEGDALVDRPSTNVLSALQGKAAGVTIREVSGSPGRTPSINVRGISSINYGSSPLYVVDGFPTTSIYNLNTADVESIEILKDAASSAIYGSRGANGVVIITTKRGKMGKPVVSFDASFSAQKRFTKVAVMNRDQWIDYAIEERTNTYIYQGGDLSVPEADRSAYHQYGIDPVWRTNPTSLPDNDWQDLITQKAPMMVYNLSVSGATDKVKYYASANYTDQTGIILNSWFKKLSFASNVEANPTRWLTLGFNLKSTYTDRQDPDSDGTQSGVARSILVAPVCGLDEQTQDGGYYKYHAAFFLNPIHFLTELENESTNNHLNGTAYLVAHIIPGLDFKSSFAGYSYSSHSTYYKTININRGNPSFGRDNNSNWVNILNENTLNYAKSFGKFDVNLLAGFTYQQYNSTSQSLEKNGYPDDEIHTLNAASKLVSGSSSASAWSLMSYLARANVSYAGKYNFSASIRRDGCSRFGSNNRWGTFPSVSASWNIANEDFYGEFKNVMNGLKARVSYGVAGNNEIGDYAAIALLSNSNVAMNGSIVGGYKPGGFANSELGWERTHTLDAGLDMAFLANRLNLSVDYYKADTKDLLLNVPISNLTGFSSSLQNIGQVRNTGIDIELKTVNIDREFKWNTDFNLSYNKNKVIKLGEDGSPIYGSSNGFVVTKTEVGGEIGAYYMFQQDGLFKNQEECDKYAYLSYANKHPQPGDIKYKDINNDGVIDDNDKTYVGSNRPKVSWGMNNTFEFKGFELSVFVDGVSKCEMLNIGKKETTQSRGNVKTFWLNRWRSEENPGNGIVPRACTTDNLTTPSTWWLEDATFWRIRTINLGYNIPKKALEKVAFLSGARLYFSVDNVYMHDHCDHQPQNATDSDSALVPGVYYDTGYPLARTWTIGVNVQF